MSATALAWVLLALIQAVASFRRPVWAVGLYMQTFFAAPHLWWWGSEIPAARYALWVSLLLAGVALLRPKSPADGNGNDEAGVIGFPVAIAMAVNATLVQYLVASRPNITFQEWVEFLKFVTLFYVFSRAIRNRADLRLAIVTIAVGAAYMGFEITVNDRGDFSGSRLEGVGAPGAYHANGLACLLLTVLPTIGALFVSGTRSQKLLATIAAPLTLNVILLCNSRGAFLGLIGGGGLFLLLSKGEARKKALRAVALGAVALFLLLGDPKILDRFATTFVGSDERDNSASSRVVYWSAALQMLGDYPLGDGGGGFKRVHAVQYLREVGSDEEARAVHNGYLTDATDWGVQGIALKLAFLWVVIRATYRAATRSRLEGRLQDSMLGVCLLVSMSGFLIASVFGSYLNSEWCFWIAALMSRYSVLYATAEVPALSTGATTRPQPSKLGTTGQVPWPSHT